MTGDGVLCGVCGAANTGARIEVLPEPAEPPDFDTRPGEPLRSTLTQWVQRCASCGYCADDISRSSPEAEGVVASEEYRAQLGDESLPGKAREFLCFAVILERFHRFADAGWAALQSAWVCDDAGDDAAASRCRERAIELWQKGKQHGELFSDDMATEFALVTDVYRRIGAFEHATVACSEGLDLEDIPPPVETMLRRQLTLIQARDRSTHSMRELVGTGYR
jgi:hypothetical protein